MMSNGTQRSAMQTAESDIYFMQEAIQLAKQAAALGEVPVGAVICHNGQRIAGAFNRRESDKSALSHAEILAIAQANQALGGWRLHECDLYVTLEPCPMCAGAIINARIRRVVYGAKDGKAGCFGSILDMNSYAFNHQPQVQAGVCEEACAAILSDFFARLRKRK